jgi:hypothetical protein
MENRISQSLLARLEGTKKTKEDDSKPGLSASKTLLAKVDGRILHEERSKWVK